MAYPWLTVVTDALTRLASFYNGNPYNASTNQGGYDNDGHRINFVPTLQDMALVGTAIADAADYSNTQATAAAASEANAALSAAKLQGTSTSTVTPALGSKSFTTQASKFFANADLKIYSAANPAIFMIGTATAYSGTSLTVNVDTIGTASSASDWVIIVTGRTGATGATGSTGSTGTTGATGTAAGLSYAWNTSTSAADPGTGKVSTNNGTLASATALYISETDANSAGLAALLATLDDGTSTNKSRWRIYNPSAPQNYWEFYVTGTLTDNGAWDAFTISHIGSGGSFTNGVAVAILAVQTGDKGDTGTTGTTGSTGATGPVIAPKFTFSTTTTDSDPGAGNLRFNNATIGSVTSLFFDNLDALGNSATAWLDTFDDSTNSALRGTLTFVNVNSPLDVIIFNVTGAVTDGTGYRKVVVTYVQGSLPINGVTLGVTFARTGNKGSDGAGSGDVVGPASAVDTNIAVFDTTTGKLLADGGSKISDLQPKDATLTALAALSTAANKVILETGSDAFSSVDFSTGAQALAALTYAADRIGYTTSASAAAVTPLTSAGRALIDDADATAQRTTLGLAIGTDVQAFSAKLSAVVSLTWGANLIPLFTSTSAVTTTTLSAFGITLIDDADAATARTTLSAQQQDATLDALAGVSTAANKLIYATGSDAFSTTDFTAAGRALVDDADATAQRTTLGVVIGTNVQAWDADLDTLAALGNWKVAYTNGSGAQTALTVGADKTILAGNGVTSAPSFRTAANLAIVEFGVTGTFTKGFTVTPNSLGNITSFTFDPTAGNLQTGINHGAFTLTAPAVDCNGVLQVINDGSASTITFSGWSVGTNVGDTYATTNRSSATVTITNASPGVVTHNAHGLPNNWPVYLTTSGGLPTGLTANTVYYTKNVATNTYQLSATPGGTAINTSSAGSGTHTDHACSVYNLQIQVIMGIATYSWKACQ